MKSNNVKPKKRLVQFKSSVRRKYASVKRVTKKVSQDFISAVQTILSTTVSKPLVLLTFVFALLFVISKDPLANGTPLSSLCPRNSTSQWVQWCRSNVAKVIGLVLFAPALVDAPARYRFFTIVSVFLWVYFVPEASSKEYAVQAVALHLFLHLKQPLYRFYVVAFAVVAYLAGYLIIEDHPKAPITIRD